MHPEQSRPLSEKPQFGGSVEVIPPVPMMTEFVGNDTSWGFPSHLLYHFVLEANPNNPERKPDLPPDQLTIAYYRSIVVLTGWRLGFMLELLACGRIARIRAVDSPLAQMMVEEPWVTQIQVTKIVEPKPLIGGPRPPATRSQEKQP